MNKVKLNFSTTSEIDFIGEILEKKIYWVLFVVCFRSVALLLGRKPKKNMLCFPFLHWTRSNTLVALCGCFRQERGLLAVNSLEVKLNLTTFLTEKDGKKCAVTKSSVQLILLCSSVC